ncbi:DUF5074 domain-containing protein [Pedobacter nanyangensis]|uniref:DUF5074 domain-containing protein n=1 Tax=Pedobacter nanyangensis TaxID=1562389 RepID=UPI000DE3BA26|nr:DUF5074 domain-containing protein [Pedobacter nanyangensis]
MKHKKMNTINKLKRTALGISVLAALLTGCKKDNEREILLTQEITGTKGIYILNEGTYSATGANSSISYYDVAKKTVVKDYYNQVNGKALGKNANDLKQYGSKLYCVVTGPDDKAESFVDVMDVNTGKTIKRIAFNGTTTGYYPRFITFYKNKAYVSRYDGKISRIDTTSLNIDAELQLKNGADNAEALEGVAVANGKLYVAGSNNFQYPKSLNDKVVVIDLNTFAKVKEITVHYNPSKIVATEKGDLYVTSLGIYQVLNPAMQKISSATDAVTQTEDYNLETIAIQKDQAWVAKDIYGTPSIKLLNLTTGKLGADLITDGSSVDTPYGLTINPFDNSVVVAKSDVSKAAVYGKEGKKLYEFETNSFPKNAAFAYTYKYVYKSL